jgi:hypothetical protein
MRDGKYKMNKSKNRLDSGSGIPSSQSPWNLRKSVNLPVGTEQSNKSHPLDNVDTKPQQPGRDKQGNRLRPTHSPRAIFYMP